MKKKKEKYSPYHANTCRVTGLHEMVPLNLLTAFCVSWAWAMRRVARCGLK